CREIQSHPGIPPSAPHSDSSLGTRMLRVITLALYNARVIVASWDGKLNTRMSSSPGGTASMTTTRMQLSQPWMCWKSADPDLGDHWLMRFMDRGIPT